MVNLKTTDNKLVAIAIGKDSEYWYVQTTDLNNDTCLSEVIQENLKSKEHALVIADLYIKKYGFKLFEWN